MFSENRKRARAVRGRILQIRNRLTKEWPPRVPAHNKIAISPTLREVAPSTPPRKCTLAHHRDLSAYVTLIYNAEPYILFGNIFPFIQKTSIRRSYLLHLHGEHLGDKRRLQHASSLQPDNYIQNNIYGIHPKPRIDPQSLPQFYLFQY